MNVLADEDIPRLVVDCLRAEGHSVLTASEADLRDASEEQRQNWRLIGDGVGIHWEDLDEDVAVAPLLVG